MTKRRKVYLFTLLSVIAFGFLVLLSIPKYVDATHNQVTQNYRVESNSQFHDSLFVSDLHADTLLWDRDLLRESKRGHLDLPRLLKGNVALQVFGVVTSSPKNINNNLNEAQGDNITLLSIAQLWPPSTWKSLLGRAKYQAQKLGDFSLRSQEKLRILKTSQDLQKLKKDRETSKVVGAILSLEGSQGLEGNLENLSVLYEHGFRIFSPAHMTDNDVSGSSTGLNQSGLSDLGKNWVKKMNDLELIIDVAHASVLTVQEVLANSTRPILISHTGFKTICNHNRNVEDELIKTIAEKGGLIGVGFWAEVTCSDSIDGVIKAILHAVKVVGVDHVALGSDFDGYVEIPINAGQLSLVTDQLLLAGLSQKDIAKIMGENIFQFLLKNLPLNVDTP